MVDRPKKNIKKIIVHVAVAIIIIFLFVGIDNLNNKIDTLKYDLETDIWNLRYDRLSYIDLSSSNFQPINSSFSILPEKVEAHLSGIKISGKILNISSVDQSNAKFKIVIGNETKEFEIMKKINSGYARSFEVYVPNVPIGESDSAEMSFIEGKLHYYNH